MWKFNGDELHSPDGTSWKACTGRSNEYNPIPKGKYTIGKATGMADVASNLDFKDPAGNVWWCPIEPSAGLTTRTGFGVHPDGGAPGTQGCIGLTARDTIDAYRQLRNSQGQKLEVS